MSTRQKPTCKLCKMNCLVGGVSVRFPLSMTKNKAYWCYFPFITGNGLICCLINLGLVSTACTCESVFILSTKMHHLETSVSKSVATKKI